MGFSKRAAKTIQEATTSRNRIHGVIKQVRKLDHPRRKSTTTIESLPRDLLVDILARVASSSVTDLFNTKLCCKDFLKAGEDEYIYECVSMDKFPVVHWKPPSDQLLSFQTVCLDTGNPEALFRQGLKEYFTEVKVESGMNYLKRASQKGHHSATFVYSMILLSWGDQSSRREALDRLRAIKYSKPSGSWEVRSREIRKRIDKILLQMWINNSISRQQVKCVCQTQDHGQSVRSSVDKGEEIAKCDSCIWYRELVVFCDTINPSV